MRISKKLEKTKMYPGNVGNERALMDTLPHDELKPSTEYYSVAVISLRQKKTKKDEK